MTIQILIVAAYTFIIIHRSHTRLEVTNQSHKQNSLQFEPTNKQLLIFLHPMHLQWLVHNMACNDICPMMTTWLTMWSWKDLKVYVVIVNICVIITGIGASHKHDVLLWDQRGFNSTDILVSTIQGVMLQWCQNVLHPVTQSLLFCYGNKKKKIQHPT